MFGLHGRCDSLRDTFDNALQNLEMVFQRLRDANSRLKPKKCTLFQREVVYLGHVVSDEGISCDPSKLEAVRNWDSPTNVTEVRNFVGLAGYYRKFIPDFSTVAYPLTQLTQKNRTFRWSDQCESSFQQLKLLLSSSPILAYPQSSGGHFVLDTDASAFGIGSVLRQIQVGEEKVIAYASKNAQ